MTPISGMNRAAPESIGFQEGKTVKFDHIANTSETGGTDLVGTMVINYGREMENGVPDCDVRMTSRISERDGSDDLVSMSLARVEHNGPAGRITTGSRNLVMGRSRVTRTEVITRDVDFGYLGNGDTIAMSTNAGSAQVGLKTAGSNGGYSAVFGNRSSAAAFTAQNGQARYTGFAEMNVSTNTTSRNSSGTASTNVNFDTRMDFDRVQNGSA